jgi:hypothetical protein
LAVCVQEGAMNTNQIVEIIRKRQAHVFDRQPADFTQDLPLYSEAGVARVIADEYEALLKEIKGSKKGE